MPNTLIVSSKQSPFPYAAISIAAYTGKADLIFDDSATGLVLALQGTPPILEEEDIVQALAKEGGLSSDTEKVICKFDRVSVYSSELLRHPRFSASQKHYVL